MNHKACDKKKQETSPLDTIVILHFVNCWSFQFNSLYPRQGRLVLWQLSNHFRSLTAKLGGGIFTPNLGEEGGEPILTFAYFSKGLVKNHQLEKDVGFWVVHFVGWGQAAMLAGFAFNFITAPMPKAFDFRNGATTKKNNSETPREKPPPRVENPMFQLAFFVQNRPQSGSREWAPWNGVLLLCLCCYGSFGSKFWDRENHGVGSGKSFGSQRLHDLQKWWSSE